MKVNRAIINNVKGSVLRLYAFGDQHIGSKDCNLDKVKEDIKKIREDKQAIVILMGDLINNSLRNSVGAGSYDDLINPNEQIDLAVKLLKPIKNKIIGIHTGNHCRRAYNETTLHPELLIAKELNISFLGDDCFTLLNFNEESYVIHSAHGSTGSSTVTGALNACLKYNTYINADVYLMGHSHYLANYRQQSYRVDKKNKILIETSKHFVLTGGYLNYSNSYAEQKSYIPVKLGCAVITFDTDKKTISIKT